MVNATNPWMMRGGGDRNGAIAGVFYFSNREGVAVNDISFRQSMITSKKI